MKHTILTFVFAFYSLIILGQTPVLKTPELQQVIELKDGGLLVIANQIETYDNGFEKMSSTNHPERLDGLTYFLSKSEEVVFGLRTGWGISELYVTAGAIGEDLSPFISAKEKGWGLYAHFVSESHINFLLEPMKSERDGTLALRWVKYDKYLNKTELSFVIPSHNIKGNHSTSHKFICEKNGELVFIQNYVKRKTASTDGAKTILMTISSEGEVHETDISRKLFINPYSQTIRKTGSHGVNFYYMELTNEIAYQIINKDKQSSQFGVMSLEGEIQWERTESFGKKIKKGLVQIFFSELNGKYLVYNVILPNQRFGHLTLVSLEDGSKIKTFDYKQKYTLSGAPPKAYLCCMVNPEAQAAQVIKNIQDKVEKNKQLKNYTMGYLTSVTSEYIWVTQEGLSKLYKFEIE